MPIHNEPKVVADYIDHPIGLYGPKGGPFNGASMMILFARFGQYDEICFIPLGGIHWCLVEKTISHVVI